MMLSLVWDQRVQAFNCVISIFGFLCRFFLSHSIAFSLFSAFAVGFFPVRSFIFDILLNETFAAREKSLCYTRCVLLHTLAHTIPVFWLCWFRFSAISIGWRRIHTVRSCYFIIVHVNSSEQNQVERRIVARLFVRVFFCVPFCSARVMRFFSHWSFVLVVDFFCSQFRSGFIKIMTVSRVSLPTKKK